MGGIQGPTGQPVDPTVTDPTTKAKPTTGAPTTTGDSIGGAEGGVAIDKDLQAFGDVSTATEAPRTTALGSSYLKPAWTSVAVGLYLEMINVLKEAGFLDALKSIDLNLATWDYANDIAKHIIEIAKKDEAMNEAKMHGAIASLVVTSATGALAIAGAGKMGPYGVNAFVSAGTSFGGSLGTIIETSEIQGLISEKAEHEKFRTLAEQAMQQAAQASQKLTETSKEMRDTLKELVQFLIKIIDENTRAFNLKG